MMRPSSSLLATAIVLGLGCGGSAAGTRETDAGEAPTGTQAPTESSFVATAAQVYCESLRPCCERVGYTYDAAGCQAVERDRLAPYHPTGTYDAQAAKKCLELMRGRLPACSGGIELQRALSDACELAIYPGTRQAGQACDVRSDCALSTEGSVDCLDYKTGGADASSWQRQCTLTKPTAALGDPCNASDSVKLPAVISDCAGGAGLYCSSTTNTCQLEVKVGEPCTALPCVAEAYCKAGVCSARQANGETCDDGSCAIGLYCTLPSGGTCAVPKPPGSACAHADECANGGQCSQNKCSAGALATADACGSAPGL